MSLNKFPTVGTVYTQTQTAIDDSALLQTADQTMAEITFNSTWSQGQADTIDKNFKEVADQIEALRVDILAILNLLKQAN